MDPDLDSLAEALAGNSTTDVSASAAGTFWWTSDEELKPDRLRSFTEMLAYCFPAGNQWSRADGEELSIRFTAATEAQANTIKRRLDEAVRRAAEVPGKPVRVLLDQWSLAGPATPATGERPPTTLDAFPVGPGLQVKGPGIARLMRQVDNLVLEIAAEIGAGEYSVPHLAAWDTIERAGYARAFPQHLTTCAVVQPDLSALDRFARADSPPARAAELRPAPVAASPAVCMQLFAAFANRTVTRPVIATARQSCARHEAGSESSATRLWSFSMREILYIGPAGGVRQFRAEMLGRLTELARAIGLPARIESANDPFFTSERQDLVSHQSNFDLKHELCGRMAGDSSAVAVSSVNLHNQHFGRGFGISLPDGTPASSACFAFGLERWAHWLHGYVGGDPAHWPAPLRRAVVVP
jgi:hypothetical protein